jgi:hypothetical protein
MGDQHQVGFSLVLIQLVVLGRDRISYNSSTLRRSLIEFTNHVPPGVSRRSKTWMTSNASSASNAAAAAAPEEHQVMCLHDMEEPVHTGCPSTDNSHRFNIRSRHGYA